MQSDDQAVATTDRSGGPATLNGPQFRPSLTLNASVNMIYGKLSTSFYGCCGPVATGPPARWRNLPDGWPGWQAVYYYFDVWKREGTFEQINAALNELDRKRIGKMPTPSLVWVDSQTGPPERC